MRSSTRAVLLCLAAVLSAADMAAARAAGPALSGDGNWELMRADTGSAADGTCVLTPKARSRIQIGENRLAVTGLPKNSIFNYQYRIDENAVTPPRIPSAEMQGAGAIYLEGDAFREILNGRRFQIRILDRWHEAITEDVDLTGAKELHARMTEACR